MHARIEQAFPFLAIVAVANDAHSGPLLAIVAIAIVGKRSFWEWAAGISEISGGRWRVRRRR